MILIRADANEQIGAGHVMRCLSLARSFVEHGEEVLFVTADVKGGRLIDGIPIICLDSIWNDLDCEIEKIKRLIDEKQPKLLLIDSYFITKNYIDTLIQHVSIAYMDDLNRARWEVDYLINYNIFSTVFYYSGYNEKTKLLLGTKYVPLRKEFKGLCEHRIKDVTDVLISAGGSDPERITEKIITEICEKHKSIRFHFIVGPLNPRLQTIREMARDKIILHINEKNMSNLMVDADIAISAAGATLYELCAAGTPTITYTLADNQLAAAYQFDKLGIMINAGDCRNNTTFLNNIEYYLSELIDDIEKRKSLSQKMKKLVDGKGADRIVETLLGVST